MVAEVAAEEAVVTSVAEAAEVAVTVEEAEAEERATLSRRASAPEALDADSLTRAEEEAVEVRADSQLHLS